MKAKKPKSKVDSGPKGDFVIKDAKGYEYDNEKTYKKALKCARDGVFNNGGGSYYIFKETLLAKVVADIKEIKTIEK